MSEVSGSRGGLFSKIDAVVNRLVKNYTLWIVAGVVVLLYVAYTAYSMVFVRLPQPPVYAGYRVLQPEWSDRRRERYYQTSQGSLVIPYAWFKALEWRTSRQLFSSPEVQTRYGLLPNNDPVYNSDQFPVGIVRQVVEDQYVDTLGEGQKEWASISCAACHTGQIQYRGTALRIDGGQGFWNFDRWSGDMVFSLMLTTAVPRKFERFCSRVYGHGDTGRCSKEEKDQLTASIKRYFNSDLIISAINALINHTYPSTEGFTRTSALGRGVNGEFGPLDLRNVNVNTGPVSFPPLWYTHDYDWVQSPTAIRQPLGRNVTEAWGVSVRVELKNPAERYASTANIEDMFWMEVLLGVLQAPKWPEDVLGKIDPARVERGRYLFHDAVWDKALPAEKAELELDPQGNIGGPNPTRPQTGLCARCHSPAFETQPNPFNKKFIQLPLYRQEVMDTDPDDAMQFRKREVYTGVMASEFKGQPKVGIGDALTTTITGILNKWFADHQIGGPCRQAMEGYRENLFRAPPAYPARPLDGYWSTGPFLHNGSVRTIYELLSPVEERAKYFYLGSREFDPAHLGYRNDPIEGAFVFDTTQDGNSNAGHEFRNAPAGTKGVIGPWLTPEQRLDIIEYLKVMNTVPELLDKDPATKDRLAERSKLLDQMAPFYENYNLAWYQKPEKEGGYKRSDLCAAIGAPTQ
jgi:hypothetical protein